MTCEDGILADLGENVLELIHDRYLAEKRIIGADLLWTDLDIH